MGRKGMSGYQREMALISNIDLWERYRPAFKELRRLSCHPDFFISKKLQGEFKTVMNGIDLAVMHQLAEGEATRRDISKLLAISSMFKSKHPESPQIQHSGDGDINVMVYLPKPYEET